MVHLHRMRILSCYRNIYSASAIEILSKMQYCSPSGKGDFITFLTQIERMDSIFFFQQEIK